MTLRRQHEQHRLRIALETHGDSTPLAEGSYPLVRSRDDGAAILLGGNTTVPPGATAFIGDRHPPVEASNHPPCGTQVSMEDREGNCPFSFDDPTSPCLWEDECQCMSGSPGKGDCTTHDDPGAVHARWCGLTPP